VSLKTYLFELKTLDGLLVVRKVAKKYREEVWDRIEQMGPNCVLRLDFHNVQFIDVSCADEVVGRILARLEAGELRDRYMILSGVKNQHKENIDTALRVSKKAIIVVNDGKWGFLGELVKSHQEVLAHVVQKNGITASELKEKMAYWSVNQASASLGALYKKRLIARELYRRPVPGGGRRFRYLSLLLDSRTSPNYKPL